MVRCTVTDPDWSRVLVSRQVIKFNLFEVFATVDSVHATRSVSDRYREACTYICKEPSEFWPLCQLRGVLRIRGGTYAVLQARQDEVDICVGPVGD